MTPDMRAQLQGELARLTEGSSPQSKAAFTEAFWRNVQCWEERFRTDSESALRDVGRAYLARVLVAEHPGSPQYAQAMREDFQHRTRPDPKVEEGGNRQSLITGLDHQ